MLIVVEAIDGAGKDTQIELMVNALKLTHDKVIAVSNISDSPVGKAIRETIASDQYIINDIQMGCLYLSELMYVANEIKKKIEKGYIVVCSRWYYSTLAYAGKELSDYLTILKISDKLPVTPNIVIYLDIDPVISMGRITNRGNELDHYESLDKLTVVRDAFVRIMSGVSDLNLVKVITVDASKSINEVHEQIMRNLLICKKLI